MYVSLISFPRREAIHVTFRIWTLGTAAELTMQHQFFPFKLACLDQRPGQVIAKHIGFVLSLREISTYRPACLQSRRQGLANGKY